VEDFTRRFQVRWADLDMNRHMRNTAYSEYAIDVRIAFLEAHGFPMAEFARRGLGPVIQREEATYSREIRPGDSFGIDYRVAGLAPDGSRWRVEHRVVRGDGKIAAVIRVEGVWLDLAARRPVPPPPELLEALRQVARTPDHQQLEPIRPR
jgi:acyl-CoA thioester hydrolase